MRWLKFGLGFGDTRAATFWIPAFAGMTGDAREKGCAGCDSRLFSLAIRMAAAFWIPVPVFTGMTFFRGNDGDKTSDCPAKTRVGGILKIL